MTHDGLSPEELRLIAALETLSLDDDAEAARVAVSLRRRLPGASVAMVAALMVDTADVLAVRDGSADALGLISELVNVLAMRLDGITTPTTAPRPPVLRTPAEVSALDGQPMGGA